MQPYEEIRRWAVKWSQEWFLDADGADRFHVAGVSAGWATHVDAFEVLMRYSAEHLLEPPERVAGGLLAGLKQHGWDRAIRATGLRMLQASASATASRRGVPAVVLEVPTPSMLDPGRIVARALGSNVVLAAADPRVWRQLRAGDPPPSGLVLPWGEERRLLRAAARDASAAHDDFLRGLPVIRFHDRDVTREVVAALRLLITRSMPWLGPERAAVDRFLEGVRPSAVAIASDQHRIGRMVSMIGAQTGVPVVVLQHGLPQMSIGLLPVVADRVAVWSVDSHDWFTRHGTDAARLVVTGNPRLDALVDLDRERLRREIGDRHGLPGSPRLLLILSPTSEATNRSVVATAIGAAEQATGASLIIKVHPGQGSWGYLRSQVGASSARSRIRILRQVSLYPLLAWASAVLLHRSTVAVEALAAGTPVIVVDAVGAESAANLELSQLNLPRVQSSLELVSLLAGRIDPAGYFSERGQLIANLTGPVDGKSSARIAELLSEPRPPAAGVPSPG